MVDLIQFNDRPTSLSAFWSASRLIHDDVEIVVRRYHSTDEWIQQVFRNPLKACCLVSIVLVDFCRVHGTLRVTPDGDRIAGHALDNGRIDICVARERSVMRKTLYRIGEGYVQWCTLCSG